MEKAHIGGLKKIGNSDRSGASYKTDGIDIGAVHWNREFEFTNDKGIYRLTFIVGNVAPRDFDALVKILSSQFGKPSVFSSGAAWNVGKNPRTEIALKSSG